jgi:hypothetical protein
LPKSAPAAARQPAQPEQTERGAEGRRQRAKTQPDSRKGILVRLNPEAWRQLKFLSAEEVKSLQKLMEEAMNDRLQRSGKPPVASAMQGSHACPATDLDFGSSSSCRRICRDNHREARRQSVGR